MFECEHFRLILYYIQKCISWCVKFTFALCFEVHKNVDPFTLNLVGYKFTAVLKGFMYFRARSGEML